MRWMEVIRDANSQIMMIEVMPVKWRKTPLCQNTGGCSMFWLETQYQHVCLEEETGSYFEKM